jgi:hypothetical protein
MKLNPTSSPRPAGQIVSCELVSGEFPVFGRKWDHDSRQVSQSRLRPRRLWSHLRPNTGNFLDSGLGNALTEAKKVINSVLYGPIPYASEQGIFCGLTGN